MNKRITALLMAALMLISMTACRSRNQETAQVSEAYATPVIEIPAETPAPTTKPVPGVIQLDKPVQNPFDDPEDENTPTDNTIHSDNTNGYQSTPAPTKSPSEPDAPEEPDVTPAPAEDMTEYEAYNAMSAEEQMAFYETFDSMADFVAWYNSVQAEHEATHGAIEVGDGNIDLSEIIHGQP